MKPLQVAIIVCVRNKSLLPTATLTFRTIRLGFPSAQLIVWDNGSDYECKDYVRQLAGNVGAIWEDHYTRMPHAYVISRLIAERPGRLVILDSDLIFWENCENWTFANPMAGRFIPQHVCEYTKCLTAPRLHSSFLWLDTDAIASRLKEVGWEDREFAASDLYHPHVNWFSGHALFYDVCANLYNCVGGTSFTEKELNSYDHIFSGSSLDIAANVLSNIDGLLNVHHLAEVDMKSLRGLWEDQDEYFYKLRAPINL